MESASAVVGDLARPQNMAAALADVGAVIHSAGLAHTMSGLPEDDYRMLNTEATIRLARAAQRAGVKRFIFLSSIRAQSGPSSEQVLTEVHGEGSAPPGGMRSISVSAGSMSAGSVPVSWRAVATSAMAATIGS